MLSLLIIFLSQKYYTPAGSISATVSVKISYKSFFPTASINKTGAENSIVRSDRLPPHRFILAYLFCTLAWLDRHIGHFLIVQITAGLKSGPDHRIPFFC